ncbi:two-component sensor histidine kinase [Fictibacillus macauensis ZFHKF-1]|uniref:histidine kinase n=1 Tax=Fictibacillus macauensis ZFHKF-1 TaxID=1196324 RepID=I8AMM4_9BACL|nr:two-component sensor histidine kinase [Fictibacillus macauensis ZFHKF-1]
MIPILFLVPIVCTLSLLLYAMLRTPRSKAIIWLCTVSGFLFSAGIATFYAIPVSTFWLFPLFIGSVLIRNVETSFLLFLRSIIDSALISIVLLLPLPFSIQLSLLFTHILYLLFFRQRPTLVKHPLQHAWFTHNYDGVYVMNQQGTVTQINENAQPIFTQSSSERLPIFHSSTEQRQWRQLVKKALNGVSSQAVFLVENKGQQLAMLFTCFPYVSQDGIIGAIGTMKDLTEVRKLDHSLQQQHTLQSVSELAAGMAHHLRNPLTTVKGFTQMLVTSPHLAENADFIEIMLKEIESIAFITDELAILAKPHLMNMKPLSVDLLFQEVLANITYTHSDTVVTLEAPDDLSPFICGDYHQIRLLFHHLIKNALEAMENGGELKISLECTETEDVKIIIHDEGSGMNEEVLQRIGEPFYTTKDNGTGLGLLLCKRIIQHHHGTFSLLSELNKGTIVTMTLPRIHQQAASSCL